MVHVLACAPAFLPRSRVQMLPSDSETDIIYKLIQMSDTKSLNTYRKRRSCMNEAVDGARLRPTTPN